MGWKVGMWDVESGLNIDIEGIDIDSKMNVKYYNKGYEEIVDEKTIIYEVDTIKTSGKANIGSQSVFEKGKIDIINLEIEKSKGKWSANSWNAVGNIGLA